MGNIKYWEPEYLLMIELELVRIRKQPRQISQKLRNLDKIAALGGE